MVHLKIWWMGIFFLLAWRLQAQDVHFSHMHRAPLHLNPASAGTAHADYRAGGVYRNQWQAVPVPYTSFMAFADGRFSKPWLGPGFAGIGLQLLTDESGDGSMRWVQGAVSVSYGLRLSDFLTLSAGVQGSFSQRSFDWSRLTFDEQFDGDQFNPGAANGEEDQSNRLSFFSSAAGAQLQLHLPESRTRLDAGVGAHHLFAPVSSYFKADSVRLSRRFSPYLHGFVQVLPRVDVSLRAWWQNQQPYSQWVAGAGVVYHLQTARDREIALELALLHRLGDALIPQIGLRYRTWEAGFSFDINTSEFQKATGRRGGPEFFLQYFLTKVKPPPVFKACPIF